MRRSFGSGGLIDSYDHEEDADPRVGLVNLADVMLVFACGLMVSIVLNWHVNLSEVAEISDSATQIDDVEEMVSDMKAGAGYSERGTVYQDPETGQLYLLEEPDEASEVGGAPSLADAEKSEGGSALKSGESA